MIFAIVFGTMPLAALAFLWCIAAVMSTIVVILVGMVEHSAVELFDNNKRRLSLARNFAFAIMIILLI